MQPRILVINPGSTSTKIAVYDGEHPYFKGMLRHTTEEISAFATIPDQLPWRKELILQMLADEGISLQSFTLVIGRGGLLRPIVAGVYEINDAMMRDLESTPLQHACNLGSFIAKDIADMVGIKAYMADPAVVDEMQDVARVSGIRGISRRSIFHALNQKATARMHAGKLGRPYEEMNLVIAHLGGGISVSAHRRGRVVDTNNALDGDGPFSPERSGTVPAGDLVRICFSGKYTQREVLRMITGKGGMVDYLGINSVQEAVRRIEEEGDKEAKFIVDAMCYDVAKYIGQMAAALKGEVDDIILTGGIAYNRYVTDAITDYCKWIAPVTVYPGEDELEALAMNARAILSGLTEVKIYT